MDVEPIEGILLYSFQENAKSEQVGYIGFAIAPRVKSDS